MKEILNYLKQIVLATMFLTFGLFFILPVGVGIFMGILKLLDPITIYQVATFGPWSMYGWLIAFTSLLVLVSPLIIFAVWVLRDSRRFKNQGVKNHPFLWFIGVILPTIIVIFPLYFIRRNITWPRKLSFTKAGP